MAKIIEKQSNFYIWFIGACAVLCMILIPLLFIEWRYFHIQAQELTELKEDYRSYTTTLKKILNDYNRTKERLDLLENYLENEKKNGVADSGASLIDFSFPSSSKVASENGDQDDNFVLLNRDLSYLRQAALDFVMYEYEISFD